MKYEKGDIIWASEAKNLNEENNDVKNHYYVLINDDGTVVPLDYYGFVLSSRVEKSKENSPYKYNEPISKDNENNLTTNSIVKCDKLFKIPVDNIGGKLGVINEDDFNRFLDAFENYLGTVNT